MNNTKDKKITYIKMYDELYQDEKLMNIGGRAHEIVALYLNFIEEFGKCDENIFEFCIRLKMPYPTLVKRVRELKELGYIPSDLFGSIGTTRRQQNKDV